MADDPYPGARGTDVTASMTTQGKPRVRMNADGTMTVFGGGAFPDWFGPNYPIAPVAPAAQQFRAYDYQVAQNLNYAQKRGPSDLPYWQLYNFAKYCDLARILIERRKNQIAMLDWNIQPRDQKVKAAKNDSRIAGITKFFQRPDGDHFWQQWLKKLLNDMLVYDAAFVYPQYSVGGELLALQSPDGTTFKFLINEQGTTPMPPWPAYQQILKGVPGFNFTKDELFYLPFNPTNERVAGYSVIEQVVSTITLAMNQTSNQLEYFFNGATPDMILSVPSTWTPSQIKEFKSWWDATLSGNLGARRGTMFVFDGTNAIPTKEALIKTPLDEWVARVLCFAFGISPAGFVSNMNRATAQSAAEQAKEEGVGPAMDWVREVMDFLIGEVFQAPDLCFRWQEEDDTDPETKTKTNQIKAANGALTINEWRELDGLDPVTDGNELMIVTASGVTLLKDVVNPPEPPPMPAPGAFDSTGKPPLPGALGAGAAKPETAKPEGATEKAAGGAAGDVPFAKRGARKLQPSAHEVAALAKSIHGPLAALGRTIAAQVARHLGKVSNTDVDAWLSDLDFADLAALTTIIESGVTQQAEDGFTDGVLEVGADPTHMIALGLPNTRAVQYAQQRAGELIGSDPAGGELADATRMMIRASIADALDSAGTVDELQTSLEDDYAFSESRAETIARTELKGAMSAGNIEGWRASGVVTGKAWQVTDEACDICQENEDAGTIGIDEDFPSGDDMPGAHPNCNCVVYPVVGDDGDSEDES